jgi:hypothetical protein
METLINRQLMKYLESRKLFNDRQYGFRSNRSTGDLIAYLIEKWNQSLHNAGESKIVALDISKAFDRVWHQAILSKCVLMVSMNLFFYGLEITFRTVQFKLYWMGSSLISTKLMLVFPKALFCLRHSFSFL